MGTEAKQGTAAWLNARRLGIGGSEIAVILGKSPFRTPYQLWLEKTGREIPEDIGSLPHVQRGVLGEKICRMKLERETLKSFTPKTWEIKDTCWRCSDDGWNEELNVILEIKCTGNKAHTEAARGIIPEHYLYQVQYNLAISEAKECWFISFQPETEEAHKIVVKPDKALGLKLKDVARGFWENHVLADVAPELTSSDFVDVPDTDTAFTALADKFKELMAKSAEIEAELETIKAELGKYTDKHAGLRGHGITVQKCMRKGSVDYARVPELVGADLDQYRKPGTTFVRVALDRRKNSESQLWPQVKP